jgi:ABC-type Mn2+/Zn2+ transport system ATPase subunit
MSHILHRLEVENLSIAYGDKTILREVTFNIPQGARVAVVGPNGAGKSTLFKALVGLIPHSGKILIHGQELGDHKDCVAYIPQREEVDWRFPVTVEDVVMMGRFNTQGWFKRFSAQDKKSVNAALKQMNMDAYAGHAISALSGGQQQRVFLARALAQEPHILLMDEPFSGVDAPTQTATFNLLDHLRQSEVTTLISTHDLNLAATHFDSILLLNRALIAFGAPNIVLQPENLRKAFGSSILMLGENMSVVDECCGPEHEH